MSRRGANRAFVRFRADGNVPAEAVKKCPRCKELRPHSEFGRNRTRPDGLAFYCKRCFRSQAAEAYRRKRQRVGFEVRERAETPPGMLQCAECREIRSEDAFARSARQKTGRNCYCKDCNRIKQRESWFRRKYGLAQLELAAMIEGQGGVCAICRYRAAGHVDHDHVRVRCVVCCASRATPPSDTSKTASTC
jgi:hypothetical protein